MELWFSDYHTDKVKMSVKVEKQLFGEQTDFQRIDVFDSKEFAKALGDPTAIDMYFTKDKLIIVAADDDSRRSFKFSSGGIIYNSELAKKIMDLSGAEFPEGKSVRVGSYEMNQLEDGTEYAEVKFDTEE